MDHKQYLEDVQCSKQWQGFLAALAAELEAQAAEDELRALMKRVGFRVVSDWPAFECGSLEELQSAVNAIWRDMDWGWVEMLDKGDHIKLAHHAAPLRAVFGDAALPWVSAVLEGVYGELFSRMGADDALAMQRLPAEPDDAGDLRFYFGRELG